MVHSSMEMLVEIDILEYVRTHVRQFALKQPKIILHQQISKTRDNLSTNNPRFPPDLKRKINSTHFFPKLPKLS